jgi:hypothetical protein
MSRAPKFARDWAQRAEADARVPEGEGTDRFSGYSVMGLTFRSGHVLALRRFPATSVGPGYTSVWHRSPQGQWTFYSTVPPQDGCSKYFGQAVQVEITACIALTWIGPQQLRINVMGPRPVQWDLWMKATLATRMMNVSAGWMPRSWWQNRFVLRTMSRVAGAVLGTGRMNLVGRTPNGYEFAANPTRIWMVASSRAVVNGVDAGEIGPLEEQARLRDFWIPQRGMFAMGKAFLRGI